MNNIRSIFIKLSDKLVKHTTIMWYSYISPALSYKDAIAALNNLQSNAEYLRNAPKYNSTTNDNLGQMKKYLLRCGINFEQLNELSIIHVAGTKGKGSTCAYIESILREHGFKTGLYTSPHLVTVRERIMINGQPINEKVFGNYFWDIHDNLMNQRNHENDMPGYFKFITIMMFHIFLKTRVDVAIIEVGIGGEYDCTNIIRNPICVGISKLDLDHVSLLGDDLKAIAYQKSGIFKSNILAFTVPQAPEAMATLFDRARKKNCTLSIVPSISYYSFEENPPILGINSNAQYYNASLAIQLANAWLQSKMNKNNCESICNNILLLDLMKTETALKNCKWPGRTQILRGSYIDFYLDGAHTVESMRECINWYESSTNNYKMKRVLMFNVIGKRDATVFLDMLKPLNFDSAFFVPNLAGHNNKLDQCDKANTYDRQLNLCELNCHYWGENGNCAASINHAFNLIKKNYSLSCCVGENDRIALLITGSLHLVGGALSILDPNLTMTTNF